MGFTQQTTGTDESTSQKVETTRPQTSVHFTGKDVDSAAIFCGVQKNRGGCIKTMKKYHLIMICHSENGGFEEYCQ